MIRSQSFASAMLVVVEILPMISSYVFLAPSYM